MTPYEFSIFPTLSTPRLILRQVLAADAADVFLFQSDYETQKYNMEPFKDISETAAGIEQMQERFANKLAITWGITLRDEKRVIGMMSFYFWNHEMYKADWGYDLWKAYWRQGIATEAGQALLKFGFEEMHLHRINVDTRMDNLASVGLMRRLGFTHEGVRRECGLNKDGTYHSWGLFGMLENEFCQPRSTHLMFRST